MIYNLLTEHHLGFLSLKGGCTGSSESTLVKMPHCWKSHATAQINSFKGGIFMNDCLHQSNCTCQSYFMFHDVNYIST